MAARVILVPCPITPLAAFSGFLLNYFGALQPPFSVRYAAGKPSGVERAGGLVLNLAARETFDAMTGLIGREPDRSQRYLLRRLLTFVGTGGDEARDRNLSRWLAASSLGLDPAGALGQGIRFFDRCFKAGRDLWRTPLRDLAVAALPRQQGALPVDERIVTLPVFKHTNPSAGEVIDAAKFRLREGYVQLLKGAHLGVMIGGPKNSGKSTLTVSLAAECANICESLATRSGWSGFSLNVGYVDLDRAAPTVDVILRGMGKNAGAVIREKQPWDRGLAEEALEQFIGAKERRDLVFADVPGGTPDEITEIVCSPADAAVLITADWNLMKEWQDFVHSMGITLVAQARSRRSEEGITSLVTRYNPNRIVAGRVVDLDRLTRSWDPFISWLAEFLLFDLLPTLVTDRERRMAQVLEVQ